MTDPVSPFGRVDRSDPSSLQKSAKSQRRDDSAALESGGKVAASQADEVTLSEVALQARQEPEFDRAKVDAIKQALQNGQYPLDSRRIAENFVAIERMIKG
jgi:negative regulator of flagellin synthesis FlgM